MSSDLNVCNLVASVYLTLCTSTSILGNSTLVLPCPGLRFISDVFAARSRSAFRPCRASLLVESDLPWQDKPHAPSYWRLTFWCGTDVNELYNA